MKRLVASLLVVAMLGLLPVVAVAVGTPISLFLNGKIVLDEPVPIIVDRQAFIELHTFARELDTVVSWDERTQKATLQHGDKTIELTVGQALATVNGQDISLEAKPFLSGDFVYLPLQVVGAELGIKANWDVLTQSLMLYQKNKKFVNSDESESGDSEQLPEEGEPPTAEVDERSLSTINSFRLSDNELILQFDTVVQPQSFYVEEPDRFVIDLPHSQLNRALIDEQMQGGELTPPRGAISNIRYATHDESTVRFVLDLDRVIPIDVSMQRNNNRISIKWASYSIVIDPGHGGRDPGADGASGLHEKHFTLSVAQKVMALLDEEPLLLGYMTRTDDRFVSLEDRVKFANDLNADLFISIHGNTYVGVATGTETFYWQENSKRFADTMHAHVVKATEFRDRLVKRFDYRVLTDEPDKGEAIRMPAVLLELGYLSTASEEKIMLTEDFQERVAAAIVAGIKDYLGLD